ncbi:hypothetical protein RI367_006590 [Sorochytrium milnesiophthora]
MSLSQTRMPMSQSASNAHTLHENDGNDNDGNDDNNHTRNQSAGVKSLWEEFTARRYTCSRHPRQHWRGIVAEFLGTLIFVYFVAGSVVVPDNVQPDAQGGGFSVLQAQTLLTAFVQGLSIAVLVATMSGISGGHINPAVTLCLVVSNAWPLLIGICYILAQVCGAMCGAGLFLASVGDRFAGSLGTTLPAPFISEGRAFLIEFMITSLLLWTVLATAADEQNGKGQLAPLPIGFAVLVGVLVGKPLTGGSMNPARSFGPALVSDTWHAQWVYWAAPLTSSIVVGILYKLLFFSFSRGKHHRHHSHRRNLSFSMDHHKPTDETDIEAQ